MRNRCKKIFQHVGAVSFLMLVTSPVVQAGEVTSVIPLNFGTIDLHPGGDTIVIAAENGPAHPQGSRSVVTGGNSGQITLRANFDVEEHVDVEYPEDVILLDCGDQHVALRGISAHSQYASTGIFLPQDGSPVHISVGGELVFLGHETTCNYSATIPIQLNLNVN